MAEEATGITGSGRPLELYKGRPHPEERILAADAVEWMMEGGSIDAPGAGAGSAHELAELIGIGELLAWDLTSSAGDWTYVCPDVGRLLHQSNRFPFRGFSFSFGSLDPETEVCAAEHNAENEMRRAGWITSREALEQMSAVRALAYHAAEAEWDALHAALYGAAMFVNTLTWDVMSGVRWTDLLDKVQPDVG